MNDIFMNKRKSVQVGDSRKSDGIVFLNRHSQPLASNAFINDRDINEETNERKAIAAMKNIEQKYYRVFEKLDKSKRRRANELLMHFQVKIGLSGKDVVPEYTLDTFSEDRIYVTFTHHKDLRVTLNFTEDDFIDTAQTIRNVEVAYLSYKKENRRFIVNNTLDEIITHLLRLL